MLVFCSLSNKMRKCHIFSVKPLKVFNTYGENLFGKCYSRFLSKIVLLVKYAIDKIPNQSFHISMPFSQLETSTYVDFAHVPVTAFEIRY